MSSKSNSLVLLSKETYILLVHFSRYIKMSSPHLNNLIIVGCMLTYLSVIFLGLDSSLSSIGTYLKTTFLLVLTCLINIFVFFLTLELEVTVMLIILRSAGAKQVQLCYKFCCKSILKIFYDSRNLLLIFHSGTFLGFGFTM